MDKDIGSAIQLLEQLMTKGPNSGPFDLFLVLTRRGMFPVPDFALISCLMQRLTFNGRANGFLMRMLCKRVKSRYGVSGLLLSCGRYLKYLTGLLMNVGDFSATNRFLSCLHNRFPMVHNYYPPISCAFLLVTRLYHMPIEKCDDSRIMVDENYDDALDVVLGFLMNALQSDAGITDSELWFSISTLLIVLKKKMEDNNEVCVAFRFFMDSSARRKLHPEMSIDEKSEIHTLFSSMDSKLKGLLHHCLQRPFFQRKLQRLSSLLRKFCPDISVNDLRIMSEALFESGFSDLSVIAWYEFLVSMDMANPNLHLSRFCALSSVSAPINRGLLPQLRKVTTLTLQSCGVPDYCCSYDDSLEKRSLLQECISKCSFERREEDLMRKMFKR
jgi:hypothetical protein